jgi:hypothetical protein
MSKERSGVGPGTASKGYIGHAIRLDGDGVAVAAWGPRSTTASGPAFTCDITSSTKTIGTGRRIVDIAIDASLTARGAVRES